MDNVLRNWAQETVASIKKQKDGSAKCDALYRLLWSGHVKEDIVSFAEDHEIPENLLYAVLDTVADRYVYEGDYDCNLSYWSNIDNLLKEELSLQKGGTSNGNCDF